MSDQPGDVVLYAVVDRVAQITLNRPDRLNASNRDLSRGLTAAFDRAAADPDVRVVLLRGVGRAFCAGADLRILDELSDDPDAPNSGSGGLRYDGLLNMDKPVIAAIHGACAGIGLALACCADIRIAADNAFFVAPFSRLGLCAEGGLAWLLPRLMGAGNASEMLFSARRVAAEEALAKGLVARVLPADRFADAALEYAAAIAEGSPTSFAMMKRQLREAEGQDFLEARAIAEELTQASLRDKDFVEAITAKRERRSPAFGRLVTTFDPPITPR